MVVGPTFLPAIDTTVGGRKEKTFRFAHQQLFILLAATIPLLLLAAFLLIWGVQEHRRTVENGLADKARLVGIAVQEQFATWQGALHALSTSHAFDEGEFSHFYEPAITVASRYQGAIVVFDAAANQLLNTRRPFGDPLPATGFPEPVRRAFATGEPQIAGPFVGVVAKHWLISLDFPVTRNGRVVYSLNLSLHPRLIGDLVARTQLAEGFLVQIINGDNKFVASSDGDEALIGQPAPAWYAAALAGREAVMAEGDFNGTAQLVAFQKLGQEDWTVAVVVPRAAVVAAWRRPIWLFGGLALCAIGGSMALAWKFSRRVTRPMETLAHAADDLLAGRTATIAPLKVPELETLRLALERAAQTARDRIIADERAAIAEASAEATRKSEERQRLLAMEIDHRAKNLLAVVQSMLRHSRARDIESYIDAAEGRIAALAVSHNLLAASRWEGASLERLIDEELAPHRARNGASPRAAIKTLGPAARLRPPAAQSLALAVHELTTNAVKFGALSCPTGRLSVFWRTTEAGLFLSWDEAGGPAVAGPPERAGFGMKVIAAGIEFQLQGRVAFDWRPQGLFVSIFVPAENLADVASDRASGRTASNAPLDWSI